MNEDLVNEDVVNEDVVAEPDAPIGWGGSREPGSAWQGETSWEPVLARASAPTCTTHHA